LRPGVWLADFAAREDRGDNAEALDGSGEIVAEELRQRTDLRRQAHGLELAAAVKLEAGLQRAPHLEGCGWRAGDGHERVRVKFEDFFRLVGEDNVARGGAVVARDDDAFGAVEREDRRPL